MAMWMTSYLTSWGLAKVCFYIVPPHSLYLYPFILSPNTPSLLFFPPLNFLLSPSSALLLLSLSSSPLPLPFFTSSTSPFLHLLYLSLSSSPSTLPFFLSSTAFPSNPPLTDLIEVCYYFLQSAMCVTCILSGRSFQRN